MKRTTDYKELKAEYKNLIETMEFKNSGWSKAVYKVANKIAKGKAIYQKISEGLGGRIPWQFIGVIHNLECSCNFNKHLHNGDSLKKRTYRVPAGRPTTHYGPFTFYESAIDALSMKGFHKVTDWSMEHMLYMLERYNGWGYRKYRTHQSPYLWSGTNHYVRGKYVADGKYSPTAVSQQMGAAPVLKVLMEEEAYVPVTVPPEALTPKEIVDNSTKLTMAQRINNFIKFAVATIGSLLTFDTFSNIKTLGGNLIDQIGIPQLTIFGVICLSIYVYNEWLRHKTINDAKDGRYVPSKIIK